MPPLKAIEQASFGGVDSRSNPINAPLNRFLLLRNWQPKPDGHLELREGYTQADMSGDSGFSLSSPPVHSISPYTFATPEHGWVAADPDHAPVFVNADGTPANGLECILFWRDKTPYLRRLDTGVTVVPPIDGAAIASSHRWQYALGKSGYLYMHNGTDKKFFDGVKFRDIGLPTLSAQQIAGISVNEGTAAPAPSDIANATMNFTTGANPWFPNPGYIYEAFFDTSDNLLSPCATPIANQLYPGAATGKLILGAASGAGMLPTSTDTDIIGLLSVNPTGTGPGAMFLLDPSRSGGPYINDGTMIPNSIPGGGFDATHVTIDWTAVGGHSLPVGHAVITLQLPSGVAAPAWKSGGPFWATVPNTNEIFFYTVDAALYSGPITAVSLLFEPFAQAGAPPPGPPPTIITLDGSPEYWGLQNQQLSQNGTILVPYADAPNAALLPASAIGGAQPGYQFYASIYNPFTAHVGNRVPIGQRLDNASDCTVIIRGLPLVGSTLAVKQELCWGNGTELVHLLKKLGVKLKQKARQGHVVALSGIPFDDEWELLIGRTGDGGEVPYVIIDNNGNWFPYNPNTDAGTLNIPNAAVDGNSELPTTNYIPPPFACFWREGDRQCGAIANYSADGVTPVSLQPFVYRSATEADDTTGIFVGDPAQAFDPSMAETFPTARPIVGGFGSMGESWVFTASDVAQLSELSGEVLWNGPYNASFGIAGPHAFDTGWNSLPFWISHDKQLCTMMPNANGPMSISTEYEAALLAQIADDVYDLAGNLTAPRLSATELTYFLDPVRLVEVLRINCIGVDNVGNPYSFVVIHDFNLRDDNSPYGQGYAAQFNGQLAPGFTQARIRDALGHSRVWAGGQDGGLYQFYSSGEDGNAPTFIADAIQLRYLGGDRTALKTIEWYGDDQIKWFLYDGMVDVDPTATTNWVNVTDEMRPVPGDARNAHYMADLQRPEMIHCYLWMQLQSHSADAPNPTSPMALNSPPHLPLEIYGRLYFTAPILGDSRGR